MRARLILEDGTECVGTAFGAVTETLGEVVFNTGLTGYQEVLSDPSYCGQIVTMTYPLIGNYGINRDDFEAVRPFIHGFVVREHCDTPSNWRSASTLDELLKAYGIPGIAGVDTRMLTRKIRHYGTMKGMITTSEAPLHELVASLQEASLMTDQVSRVSTKSVFSCPGSGHRVVLVDFGAKHGILRELTKRGCDVVVVPYNVTAEEIRRIQPDGILLSNGPGDPKDVPQAIQTIREILGQYPLFGICLGHQLFALASGADTEKLKFGHRGGNHPVKELATGRTYITSQNHGYAVTEASIKGTSLEITHVALNDGTIEGLRDASKQAFSVQYHPEAAPGPYDSGYLFDQFMAMIASAKEEKAHAKAR
ncbi:glutamine-hydrolyzing carbamoyl-phosphate synthase small subunit [Brevibacillus sp. SYP-B805]|uniref:carbamoyl phosphate synthase small subunit n=1 Tax=Brevibacillus sp. SYP-B805 TaxID=1578199 RepID=UPI0013EC167D|nr:carbamoyl phosphate synthase small subunit [Brevibacillus sp. SYP-B805]NGQ93769.1 glutamine-hydrolyzing carbamoyl-phosphate synthase small subunit [Brevibacillus sp. SYP-B805]